MKFNILFLAVLLIFGITGCNNSESPDGPGKESETPYVPGDPSEVEGDMLITISSGVASQFQGGENIEKSWDKNINTLYHSPYYGTKFPLSLEYRFENPELVDYIIYKPRNGGDNGLFGELDLFVATKSNPEFTKIGSYDFKFKDSPSPIYFDKPIKEATAFKFSIKTGCHNYVSCAEMEFWRYGEGSDVEAFKDIFADDALSELVEGVTRDKITKMNNTFFKNIALAIYDEKYDMEFRVQEYEPYPTRSETATELKIGGYNPFENPTGIYFPSLSDVIIIVGDTDGESLSLQIHNFGTHSDEVFFLKKGINKFTTKTNGLGYISYFTTNWKNAPKVKIHIASGKVNGCFDVARHTSADWQRLIGGAVSTYFDLKGKYMNLAYTTEGLRNFCEDGRKLVEVYDEIVDIEHDLMGLKKYNRRPKNHMFARATEGGLFADGWGAGFWSGYMHELASVEGAKKEGVWAIAHEFGHINQMSPGLKWVGTTEVTNNVYSVTVRHHYNGYGTEQERCNDGDNNHVIGGRITAYLNYGVVKGEPWQCQRGQDAMDPAKYYNGGDYGVKLSPFWQLLLYYRIANTDWQKKDWYGDVAEIVRNTDRSIENNRSNGEHQLNFMKLTMDVIGEDLTDFFQKSGMLKPIDREIDDYSRGWLKITQAQCDELIAYAKKYPKPASPVIYYITAPSLKAYESRLLVSGSFGQGVQMITPGNDAKDYNVMIDGSKWKNVTVFETYKGDELTYVAMVGTDSEDFNSTKVRYPAGSTRIEAVAWDGTRTLVYGTR